MNTYNKAQLFSLVTLRVIIGWHFLVEGLVKLANPAWTSMGYLLDSQGIFSSIFHFIAYSPVLVDIADQFNIWGLIAIGLSLITGTLSRMAVMGGIALLGFYYLSHPPFVGVSYNMPTEGSYLIVDKVLIEMVSMIVLFFFPTSKYVGLDRFVDRLNQSSIVKKII